MDGSSQSLADTDRITSWMLHFWSEGHPSCLGGGWCWRCLAKKGPAPRTSESLQDQLHLHHVLFGNWSGTPNPYNLSEKYWQYTSNLYRSATPICNAVPRWLLSLEERETPQYTSNLCRNMPPICTVVRLPFVLAILLRKYQGLWVLESSWVLLMGSVLTFTEVVVLLC